MSRKVFIDYIVNTVAKLEDNNPTPGLLKDRLEAMSDAEIENLVTALENRETYILYLKSNFDKETVDLNRWYKVADEIGAEIEARVWKEDSGTGDVILSQEEYPIVLLPKRRLIQHVKDKTSATSKLKSRDAISGQVVGDSKTSSMSRSKLLILRSLGFDSTSVEYVKTRGGDRLASGLFYDSLRKTGSASIKPSLELDSESKAITSLRSELNAMHYDTTL